MRLKKLSIFGFKSFADKVVLDFDSDIAAIVGPNGCGKSNIVDAFRWVMGEQSAKSLRGDKMHDVLFAGTDTRKQSNYAEVSLTFTDINDELFTSYSELCIARRLYRNGESEYFINKQIARLKDIQTLFLGSGTGKDAFSIFEQGKLDQIIQLAPLERRAIFDEAAGTSRFLLRKKETMRKIAQVNENFTRVRDVHEEVERQTKHLKKQATLAKNVQESTERLNLLEKNVLLSQWRVFFEKTSSRGTKLEGLEHSIQRSLEENSTLEEIGTKSRQALAADEMLLKQRQKELSRAETSMRVLESEIGQQKSRVLETKKRHESVQVHLKGIAEERQSNEGQIKEKKAQLEALNVDPSIKEQIKKKRKEHLEQVQEEGRLSAQLKEKSVRLEGKLARSKVLNDFESKYQESLHKTQSSISTQQQKVALLSEQIDQMKEELVQVDKERNQLREDYSQMEKEEKTLSRSITESEGHQKALMRLKEEMEGFSNGAKVVLKEAKNEKSPLFKKIELLIDHLIPQKGYEGILAQAMKNYAATLIVATEKEFEELLSFAAQKKISDFSVVIASRINQESQEGSKRALIHFLENGPIASHFASSFEVVGMSTFYDPLGVFFNVSAGKGANAFQRNAELKTLADLLANLREKAAILLTDLQKKAEILKSLELRRTEMVEGRRKKEMDLVKENFVLQVAISDQEKLLKEMALVKKEREGFGNPSIEAQEIVQMQERIVQLKRESENFLSQLQSQEACLEKWEALDRSLHILKTKEQQSALHEKKMKEELCELEGYIEKAIEAIALQEKDFQIIKKNLSQSAQEVKESELRLASLKKAFDSHEKELSQKKRIVSALDKEKHGYEIAQAQDLTQQKAFEQKLQEQYGLACEQLTQEQILLDCTIEEAQKEIQRLRSLIEASGTVNMAAIEELAQVQQRFDFLDSQLRDLEGSKKDLEEITLKLDQESRKIFKKTFQQIKENFQKNFAILFNGGSADLTFTEHSDILEAGIEIMAKPPGKQMRAISLLSGGEKCLTALALLFSIFEVKRAPFCILDEVDAPLDDSNVDRFTQVLRQFTDKTQFIIVTHNKKTMVIADFLIGVSMEEKGVSKLISLAFERKAENLSQHSTTLYQHEGALLT